MTPGIVDSCYLTIVDVRPLLRPPPASRAAIKTVQAAQSQQPDQARPRAQEADPGSETRHRLDGRARRASAVRVTARPRLFNIMNLRYQDAIPPFRAIKSIENQRNTVHSEKGKHMAPNVPRGCLVVPRFADSHYKDIECLLPMTQ